MKVFVFDGVSFVNKQTLLFPDSQITRIFSQQWTPTRAGKRPSGLTNPETRFCRSAFVVF